MRRHAFFMSVSFGVGIYLTYVLHLSWHGEACLAALLVPWPFLFSPPNRKMIWFILGGLILGGCVLIQSQNHQSRLVDYADRTTTVYGMVSGVVQKDDRASLTIKTTDRDKILLNIYTENPMYATCPGKRIRVTGTVGLPKTAGNPGGFDYRLYLRSVGIQTLMSSKPGDIWISQKTYDPLLHALACFREEFRTRLAAAIGEDKAGVAMGILLGDRSDMGEETYEAFQRNGTAHILSVSGLHVGFVYSMLAFLIRGKRKPLSNGVIMSVLLFYGLLSGFCPSVDRALLMIGFHVLSKVLNRPYDLLTAAGVTGLILLACNPFQLFHIGFQLSFLAVILMGWLYPLTTRLLPKKSVLQVLLPIPLLQLSMAPFTAFCFNYFTLGGFVANGAVVFFSGLMIPAGMAAMLAVGLPGPLFDLTAVFLDLCLRCTLWCNEVTYAHGKTSFDVTSPRVFALICFYGLFFFLLSEQGRILWVRREKGMIALVLTGILLSGATGDSCLENGFDKADAVFVDVGQGDCLHIRTPSGHNVLIDGGGNEKVDIGKRVVKPYLLKNGVKKIDLAIATHLDTDHYRGLQTLAKGGMVKRLGLYEGNELIDGRIRKETGLDEEQLYYLSRGDKIKVDRWLWLEILYPEEKSKTEYENELREGDENPRSLVVRAHLGQTQILMTGDIDTETEEEVISANGSGSLSSTVLKIAHHGSKFSTSDAFLAETNPVVAVFQVGKNNYGHPDRGVLEKCGQKGIMTYRTDQNGAVGFFGLFDEDHPYVRVFRKNAVGMIPN